MNVFRNSPSTYIIELCRHTGPMVIDGKWQKCKCQLFCNKEKKMSEEKNKSYTVFLTDVQFDRLMALAIRRNRTMNQCIVDFIDHCVLEDNWEHPEKSGI